MRKSIIFILFLVLVVLAETILLVKKSKNSEPVMFTLASQEYDLPPQNVKIAPLIFETDFIANTDTELAAIAEELDGSFGIHLSQIFRRLTVRGQKEAEEKALLDKKTDDFIQAMSANPVSIRGVYLEENICEVDGVRGICADGVYKMEKHCIACFDGVCAATACADDAGDIVIETADEEDVAAGSEPQTADGIKAEEFLGEPLEADEVSEPTTISEIDEKEVTDEVVEPIAPEALAVPQPEEKSADVAPKEEPVVEEDKADPAEIIEPKTETAIFEDKEQDVAAEKENKALIAVVIDDIGLSVPFTNQLAEIKYPLTVSFLPYGASNKEQVYKLKNAGMEVMLHVPMMPRVPADLAPVTLSPQMSKAEIQEKFVKMLERFDETGMHGVNNHMGSAFTEDREAMRAVMEILQNRGMYFLDSKTTGRSVGRAVSSEYGVPYAARDVFLDNERRYDYIMGQLKATERVAKNKGYAIAIGHPYAQTLQALRDWLKDVEKRGIKIVPLSDLVAKTN